MTGVEEPARGRIDPLAAAWAHCERLVRAEDPDRYFAALFAPAALRPPLFALAAFSVEVARVRDAVSAPMPGEIRLQWWRDAVEGIGREAGGHPVAAALEATIARFSLPRQPFVDLIDARVFDLYDDPMPSIGDLEGYLGETASAPIRLACLILADGEDPGAAEAAGHAGLAVGLTGLLRAVPWHSGQGRLYLPKDVLHRHGVTRDDVVLRRGGPGFVAALADVRTVARGHLMRLRELSPTIPPKLLPAFLPVALAPGDLAATERTGYDPFRTRIDRPAWRTIARLWWASMRGGT